MDDLNKALGDISSIRRQMARSTEFRGYGPATLASTGFIAIVAAVAQQIWLTDPARHVLVYLGIWFTTAALSAGIIGTQMVTRAYRVHSGMADEMIHMAVEQFLPSMGAGGLVSLVLVNRAPGVAWMLPSLWLVTFSLGVFASCRFLPRLMVLAGVWYLAMGLITLGLGDARSLAPWTMGLSYGAGQLLVAAILALSTKENRDER
ncbi:hypothetical protein [Occallatibacter riparius]|uniref:Uncharacterized protein n=1 Tax=Occallatibacter riparius TaxID=1002689 RepID=A0A9J7BIC3_9BACT|nr:hypothetical protein [Occallatibacter riparius]UWZ82544.1 hypothetical protein MOP44_18455 [Occallatibacter riparius]